MNQLFRLPKAKHAGWWIAVVPALAPDGRRFRGSATRMSLDWLRLGLFVQLPLGQLDRYT